MNKYSSDMSINYILFLLCQNFTLLCMASATSLLNQIIVFEYLKNISQLFGAVHNVMATDTI